jgi:hypothetical protein
VMPKTPGLDPREARPLTSREVAKLLGAHIAALAEMSTTEQVCQAVKWWAQSDDVWAKIEEFKRVQQRLASDGVMNWLKAGGPTCPNS